MPAPAARPLTSRRSLLHARTPRGHPRTARRLAAATSRCLPPGQRLCGRVCVGGGGGRPYPPPPPLAFPLPACSHTPLANCLSFCMLFDQPTGLRPF